MPTPTPQFLSFLSYAVPGVVGALSYLAFFRRRGRGMKEFMAVLFVAIFYIRLPIAILHDFFIWAFASPLLFGEWGKGVSFWSSCILGALLGAAIGRWMRGQYLIRHPEPWPSSGPNAPS
ncbi:MAG: hypothetical protein ABW210_10900 [Achromobacter sp.]